MKSIAPVILNGRVIGLLLLATADNTSAKPRMAEELDKLIRMRLDKGLEIAWRHPSKAQPSIQVAGGRGAIGY